MWYVLAAANALSGDADLTAGTQLKVPEMAASKNDATSFRPYNPGEIVGSTSPGLPYVPSADLSCKQTMILIATTIVRVVATFYGGVGGAMIADALMQKVEINAGIRSEYSLGETVAAGIFAAFGPVIQSASTWAKVGYAAVAAATAYSASYLVDKSRGADVHFNWGNLAASVVTSMISTKLGAVGNTGVAAGGSVSATVSNTAFSWTKVATDTLKNLGISAVNKGVTQLITGDKANWDAGGMFADSFGNAAGSAIAVKMNQKFLSSVERKSLNKMSPQEQNEYEAQRAQGGMTARQAFDYVTNAGGLRSMGEAWFGLGGEEIGTSSENTQPSQYDATDHIGEGFDTVYRTDRKGFLRDAGAGTFDEMAEIIRTSPLIASNGNVAVGSARHESEESLVTSKIKLNEKTAKVDVDYTLIDAENGLKKVMDVYGQDMAKTIEQMYRLEASHFKSLQYRKTGTPGMEVHGSAPYYGWSPNLFKTNPEYTPNGIFSIGENAGLSVVGGTKQITARQKEFVRMPSVEAGMMYLAEYVNRYEGNYARWYSTETKSQEIYRARINSIIPRISNKLIIERNLIQAPKK